VTFVCLVRPGKAVPGIGAALAKQVAGAHIESIVLYCIEDGRLIAPRGYLARLKQPKLPRKGGELLAATTKDQ
jgi:hypothetical protein